MPDIFLGRQPIYDRRLRVVAYELLYRTDRPGALPEGSRATSVVAFNALMAIGLDRLVRSLPAFVNVNARFLMDASYQALPPGRVVLEVLEDVRPTPDLLAAARRARELGYRLALDDFVYGCGREPLLELADVVKVEIGALDEHGIRDHAARLRRPGLQVLAEKVETPECFELCREAGYDQFQGYFFCRPSLRRATRPPTGREPLLVLLAQLQDPHVDFAEIENLVGSNVALSYNLLRYINSAAFGLTAPVESIRHAIVLLGRERIRACVTLLLLAGIDDKPHELMMTALIRGRMCQLLARAAQDPEEDAYFTVGLFSVLDALMDRPLEALVDSLPLTEPVKMALIARAGAAGTALRTALAFERGNFEDVASSDADRAQRCYVEALDWAAEMDRHLQ